MNQTDRDNVKFLVRFSVVFAGSSLAFSFLSWGRAALGPPEINGTHAINAMIDIVEHGALGAIVALPVWNKSVVAACAAAAMLIDVDHVGAIVGLPLDGRASHSVPFAVFVTILTFLLARRGVLGRQFNPLLASSIALAAVIAHLAWDAIPVGTNFPLWAPFTYRLVFVPWISGVVFAVMSAAILWAAASVQRRHMPRLT